MFLASAVFAGASTSGSQSHGAFSPVAMELLPVLERAKDTGAVNPNDPLSLTVNLAFAKPAEMQAFVDSVSNPKSPNYRHFITPDEVGTQFGQSTATVQSVVDYLAQSGFTISLVAKNHLSIIADGTVVQAEAAFHTTLRQYSITPTNDTEPAQFFAFSSPVQMPAEFASIITDITGLENYTRPRHLTTLLTPPLTRGCYDTANMFNNQGLHGEGRTIGIANWVGLRSSNYLLYISHFSLPVPGGGAGSNIVKVPCNGGGLSNGPDDAEGDLDVQMELGMAPLANIRIYDGSAANNLTGMLTVMVNDNASDVLSESYGWQLPAATATASHNLHLSMSAQGITYMAASGDSGTAIDPFSYPDYDPDVLMVGGTIANVNNSTGVRVSEVGWSGSGGGWSTNGAAFNVKPAYQVGTGVLNVNKRLVPDVAFHAAGTTSGAYQFYTGNGALTSAFDGTSFASPVFAGMLAIVEQKVIALGGLPPDSHGKQRFGRIQDLIYSQNGQAGIWFDVLSGSNGKRPDNTNSVCTPGWDSVTGWGPMDCEAFALAVAPQGCGSPTVYCTAKVNSQLCIPAIGSSGSPSATSASPFNITASQMLNNKFGLLFYSFQPSGAPFQGGNLCCKLPITRTALQSSGGSASGTDCSGTYSFNFNAWIQGGIDPNLIPTAVVYSQYWARDPNDLSGFTTSLSDALTFTICP